MKFNNLYKELLPKKYKELAEQLLKEGLIVSHGINVVKKSLYINFKDYIVNFSYEPFPLSSITKYGVPVLGEVTFKPGFSEDKLISRLNFHGYFISKTLQLDNGYIMFGIEPKKPSQATKELIDSVPFLYHITPKINLLKIKKIGLTPKISKTSYNHPGDRIFLFYTDNPKALQVFVNVLARDKNLKYEDMAILRITKNLNADYYIDESSTSLKSNLVGFFTLRNISPQQINIYDS